MESSTNAISVWAGQKVFLFFTCDNNAYHWARENAETHLLVASCLQVLSKLHHFLWSQSILPLPKSLRSNNYIAVVFFTAILTQWKERWFYNVLVTFMKTCSASLIICLLDPRCIGFATIQFDYAAQAVLSNLRVICVVLGGLYMVSCSNFNCFGKGWHRAAQTYLPYVEKQFPYCCNFKYMTLNR